MSDSVLRDIAFRVTNRLAGHPLFNEYFQNTEDFQSLIAFEEREFATLIEHPDKVFDHFVVVGERLYDQYQPPFVDVAKMIEFATSELQRAVRKKRLASNIEDLNGLASVVENALAKAYFLRTLGDALSLVEQCPENASSPMMLHLHWLAGVIAFFRGETDETPEADHLSCGFAGWMKGMECELLLHSTGRDKDAQLARVYMSHRKLHQQFSYIRSFVKAEEYALALSHWSLLYQAVLELGQHIRNLQLIYKEDEEAKFFAYVDEKSGVDDEVYYFLSLRLTKWLMSDGAMDGSITLKQRVLEYLHDAGLDGVSFANRDEIRILIQDRRDRQRVFFPEFLEQQLHAFLKRLAQQSGMKSRSVAINLDSLNGYPQHKISMLRQLSELETEREFELITGDAAETLYKGAVEAESVAKFASRALEEGTLEVFFQPIVGLRPVDRIQVEALARAPKGDGYLAADRFIQFLEREGRMGVLDRLVIDKISDYAARLAPVVDAININIYPTSFRDQQIVDALVALSQGLARHKIGLTIEITEQMFLGDTSRVEWLASEHGISFSLDDFGSGYSNLIQLIGLTERGVVKSLKIDGSLVRQVDQDERVLDVIDTITQIAKKLGITPVVMEFVETDLVMKKLQRLNAEIYFQGFYFDRPLPVSALVEKYAVHKTA